jgi:branched-chain amino acid transport system ATP-binding protein
MLEVSGITKHFDGVHAVDNASLKIPQATITSLIGPNGAGKTTLFNIICGYIEPDKGAVQYNGKNLNGCTPHERASAGIGRTFQNMRLIKRLSALENLMLAFIDHKSGSFIKTLSYSISRNHELRNEEKAYDLLDFVGMKDKANEPAGALSYGQQKLLSLACCLALDAKLLMLDEPVAGVNQETIKNILSLFRKLKNSGITIFLIEHNMDVVMEISDRLIVMDEGRIIADGIPSVVKEKPEVIEAYIS